MALLTRACAKSALKVFRFNRIDGYGLGREVGAFSAFDAGSGGAVYRPPRPGLSSDHPELGRSTLGRPLDLSDEPQTDEGL